MNIAERGAERASPANRKEFVVERGGRVLKTGENLEERPGKIS